MTQPAKFLLLSLLSGLLLFLSWPVMGFAPLIFIALVPLLWIEHRLFLQDQAASPDPITVRKGIWRLWLSKPVKSARRVFWYSYLTFFIWNVSTTWWIWNATAGGAVLAILANSLLMAVTFWLYHRTKRRLKGKFSWLILIAYWITFEYFHMHWDLSWTWLTLGNVFSEYYNMVQWYEYTGVFAGSLWVLAGNLMVTHLILQFRHAERKEKIRHFIYLSGVLVLPVLFSVFIIRMSGFRLLNDDYNKTINVVVVQPNIDPYNEKFSGNYQEQLVRMLELAAKKVDSTTDYAVFPETALQENLWEGEESATASFGLLNNFLARFPGLKIVIGASSAKAYQPGEPLSPTARKFRDEEGYYDYYNTAYQLDPTGKVQTYHKSILVPGVEKMPFPKLLWWLEDLSIKMGGSSGSLGIQNDRTVFTSHNDSLKVAPVICYESIYGDFVRQYINKGADLICIITNDGWWGNTPGYKQHLSYASLRAIETRTCIARSANTGISCFIDQQGNRLQPTGWWEEAVIQAELPLNTEPTFYTRFGDYVAYICVFLTAIFCGYAFYRRFTGDKL
jgi:apolipoprotein N-acyltransferase